MITKDTDKISFDDESELREQAGKLMRGEPEPEPRPTAYIPPDLTDAQWIQLYLKYISISNHFNWERAEKWIGLKSLGLSDEECEDLCRPKEIDREQVKSEVGELSLKEQNEWSTYNRESRSLGSEQKAYDHCPLIAPTS